MEADGVSELSCTFTPPGLLQGLAITVVSLVVLAVLGALGTILRRRRPSAVDPAA